jgi:hypothetical protein
VAQDLSELAGGEFTRSTCAADHFSQPLLSEDGHCRIVLRRKKADAKDRFVALRFFAFFVPSLSSRSTAVY